MASRQALLEYIQAAKMHGASDDFLLALLKEAGWPNKEIFLAFEEHYRSLTGLAVPGQRGAGERAKDAFLYLLSFATLATWTVAVGSIFFTLIDTHFPDPLNRAAQPLRLYNLANNLAALIVAFPIYLLVTRLIIRGLEQSPEARESGVRKWLTYIAMLIAVGIVIGDLVTFLTYFLRGDLTVRFVLKVVVVLVIAGGVLLYYLGSLRRPDAELVAHESA